MEREGRYSAFDSVYEFMLLYEDILILSDPSTCRDSIAIGCSL